MARWEALNSTGRVTSWKSTTTAYMMMAAVVRPGDVQDDAGHEQEDPGVRGQVHRRHDGPADLHGRVVLGVLAGMAHLMAGRGRGGDGAPVEGLGESVTELLRGSK